MKTAVITGGNKEIVINAVVLAPVETDMMDVIPEGRKQEIKSSVFTNRFAKAEEVGDVFSNNKFQMVGGIYAKRSI